MNHVANMIVVICLCTLSAFAQPPAEVTVSKVLDGDTLDVVADGVVYRIRLIGVGAPERYDIVPCARRMAMAATAHLQALVKDVPVRLAFDIVVQDRYGRWLGYVYVGDIFVNASMLEAGWAAVADSGKNRRYRTVLAQAEARAKAENRGMWGE